MTLITVALALIGVVILIPCAVLFMQVVASLPSQRNLSFGGERPSVAVVIPAHDEETVIADTLASLASQLGKDDRLLVVADNCTDNTAELAARLGAEVIERHDTERRGKGYALDYALRYLRRDPRETIVIVDADCNVCPGTIDYLSRACHGTGRPIQALYLMQSPRPGPRTLRIAEFAWLLRNYVRPLGYSRLGLPCQLTGSGMALPWGAVVDVHIGSDELVEDLALGLRLTELGAAPVFCPNAVVTSDFPVNEAARQSQRMRWEHGHLMLALSTAWVYATRAVMNANLKLLALVVDVCVPPITLLCALIALLFVACFACLAITGRQFPLSVAAVSLALVVAAIAIAWLRHGRHIISFGELLWIPLYAAAKLPIYVRFVIDRQVDWVKTKRTRN